MCFTLWHASYLSSKKMKGTDEFLMEGEKGGPHFRHKASGSAKLREYSIVLIWLGGFRKHCFHILFSALKPALR